MTTPRYPRNMDRGEADLYRQGGVVASLMELADVVQASTHGVAQHIRHVAEAIDDERRGMLSMSNRRQIDVLQANVEQLLASFLPVHDGLDVPWLVAHLGAMADELRRLLPEQPEPAGITGALDRQRETGREAAARIAAAITAPRKVLAHATGEVVEADEAGENAP